ncbi:MAG: UbiA family prenyltransferase [Candidatus Helarchaeota archaeon]
MIKLKAFLGLIRPINTVGVVIAVLLGALIAGGINFYSTLICILAAFTASAGGMVENDIIDLEIDRINAPERVLPSSKLSKKSAIIFMIILFSISQIIIFLTNWLAIFIITTGNILIILYSLKLKQLGFIGNVVVGITTGYCFLLGGASFSGGASIISIPDIYFIIAPSSFKRVIFPAVSALLMNIGREITKGIDDIEGDKKLGIKTITVTIGAKRARYFAITFYLSTIIFSIIPFLLGYFTLIYLLIALIGVDSILCYSIYSLMVNYSPENAHRIKKLIMFAFYIGFFAFLLGIPYI